MSMIVIVIFKAVGASLSMKCNPGLILQLFKSVVNSEKYRIISLLLLLFIAVARMTLQQYTYMKYMSLFILLDVMGKRLHRSE